MDRPTVCQSIIRYMVEHAVTIASISGPTCAMLAAMNLLLTLSRVRFRPSEQHLFNGLAVVVAGFAMFCGYCAASAILKAAVA